MNNQESVEKTRKGFESSFAESSYYNRQTQDVENLDKILKYVDTNGSILDLGTGSGYLAFPLATRNPNCHVVGLDIVYETLKRNRQKAEGQAIANLDFVSYDGINFPLENQTFDTVVTRYALHHFPDINKTFCEIGRVLKPGGQLFISEPTLNGNDENHFVDTYMQMKDDGHIRFYTENEFEKLAGSIGLKLENSFMTEIRFPRKISDDYYRILNGANESILNGYAIKIVDGEIFITEKVLNLFFRSAGTGKV